MTYGNLQNDRSQRRALEALLAGTNELPADALFPGSVSRPTADVLADLGTLSTSFASLQAAIDAVEDAGGGTVLIPAGTFNLTTMVTLPPGVILRGMGRGRTVLKAASDITLIGQHGGARSGIIGIEDLTLWGYGDQLEEQGAGRLCNLGPCDFAFIKNVEGIYSANLGLTANGTNVLVEGCYVHECFRDGINVVDSDHKVIRGNVVYRVGDDGIACGLPPGASGLISKSAVVEGNSLSYCYGIKALGAQNITIKGNRGRFLMGYFVYLGYDATFGDGYTTMHGVAITGNSVADIIPKQDITGATLADFIHIYAPRSQGADAGGTAIVPTYIGEYDSTGHSIIKPYPWVNKAEFNSASSPAGRPSIPIGAHHGFTITGNSFEQTLAAKPDGTAATVFSDFGYGTVLTSAGEVDPTSTTLLRRVGFINVNGTDIENFVVDSNAVTAAAFLFKVYNATRVRAVTLSNNNIFRCNQGVVFDPNGTRRHYNVTWTGGWCNLDPYLESSLRTISTDYTGGWDATASTSMVGLYAVDTAGVIVEGVRFANLREVSVTDADTAAVIQKCYLHWDWSESTPRGIKTISAQELTLNYHVFEWCAPTNAQFRQGGDPFDSFYRPTRTSAPTFGMYGQNHKVFHTAIGSSGTVWWECYQSGGAHAGAWAGGATYTAGTWRKMASGAVWQVITAGGGTTSAEPSGTGDQTTADGYVWRFRCYREALFRAMAPA